MGEETFFWANDGAGNTKGMQRTEQTSSYLFPFVFFFVVDLSSLDADVPNECLHACTNQKLCISHERNETNRNRRRSAQGQSQALRKSDAAGRRKEKKRQQQQPIYL